MTPIKKKSRRQEKITVMLIPSAMGKPFQFQTSKRMLKWGVLTGVISFVLLIGLGSLWAYGAISDMLVEKSELAQENITLRAAIEAKEKAEAEETEAIRRYKSLFELFSSYKEATIAQIGDLNTTVRHISDFTGLKLDEPTTESLDIDLDELGRGGPINSLMSVIDPEQRKILFSVIDPLELDLHIYQLEQMDKALTTAHDYLEKQENLLLRTPLILPVNTEYRFSDVFGPRTHPMTKRPDFHGGLDIAAKGGTPIIAAADGEVTLSGRWSTKPALGLMISIDHGKGVFFEDDGTQREVTYRTRYAHCRKLLVKKGDHVKRGDTIALVGSSGQSTGNHLHYEVLIDGQNVDPKRYILNIR